MGTNLYLYKYADLNPFTSDSLSQITLSDPRPLGEFFPLNSLDVDYEYASIHPPAQSRTLPSLS